MSPYMDPVEPEELAKVLATLPPQHQDAIRAGWRDIVRISRRNQRLLRKTLRTVTVWLFCISIVLAGVGYWSVHSQYQTRLERCQATNRSHQRSINYVGQLTAKMSALHPSMRTQFEQSAKYDDRLLDMAFPYVKDCHAFARGHSSLIPLF